MSNISKHFDAFHNSVRKNSHVTLFFKVKQLDKVDRVNTEKSDLSEFEFLVASDSKQSQYFSMFKNDLSEDLINWLMLLCEMIADKTFEILLNGQDLFILSVI
jgi:hypothetical protein